MDNKLEGLWSLISMKQSYDDGREVFPMGEDAQGRIFYGTDGTMFTAIQRNGRGAFKTGAQWTATDQEKAQAYNEYLSYFGTYAYDGEVVSHNIEISIFPNWIGQTQKRKVDFIDGTLCLSARLEDGTPEARTALLIWKPEF